MSPTLGEKLRQARESRGLSINNISEQTRIASHHLAAIESDDYSGLPGGIFNKGFIRSFAKCVGIDETEALADYSMMSGSAPASSEGKPDELYSPAVYSDSKASDGRLQTILLMAVAFIIVAGGLGATAYYLIQDSSPSTPASKKEEPVAQSQPSAEESPTPDAVSFDSGFSVEISASGELVQFLSEADGVKAQKSIEPGSTATFDIDSELNLSIYRTFVPLVTLKVNGKEIALPKAKGNTLKVTIDRGNVAEIFEKGEYASATRDDESTTAAPTLPANVQVGTTGTGANGSVRPSPPANRPRANVNRPVGNRPRVASNTVTSRPN